MCDVRLGTDVVCVRCSLECRWDVLVVVVVVDDEAAFETSAGAVPGGV